MRNRLGVRLALLIVLVGPIVFFVFMNIVYIANRLLGNSQLQNAFWILIALITTPLAMGMVAAWYVNRRLRQFTEGIALLQTNNYRASIPRSGIQEFDEVTGQFNKLVKRLGQEEELRKDLISDTSHELNTPLAAMLSQITALQENVLEATPERLQVLRDQTERLIDMIAQLDAYTEARLPAKTSEPLSLQEVAQTVKKQLQPLLNAADMQLAISVKPAYVVTANREALEHILMNVIRNAVKYSRASQVVIQATPDGFAVSDNGIGVPAKDHEHLFERFYRVDKSRNRASGGLGLGLAIVKELATQQGWRVHAEDAQPGLRIRFVVR